jgi:NAD(P)-dependent dehydrogenase (short-subunit alcohol dehydrogenase family)
MKLENNVAIVTGGGQGIGRGIVRCMAEEGADIAIVEINPDTAQSVAAEVTAMGRRALAVVADATDGAAVEDAVKQVIDHFGRIDILVNNVGGTDANASVVESAADAWDGFYRLSLKAHVIAAQAVIPHMKAQKSGKIINISSEAAWVPTPTLMAYGAFKMADVSFTRSLALELAAENINVNCICPGVIWTPLWERLATALVNANPALEGTDPREFFEKRVVAARPMGREETPEDIGRAAVFFASEDARNITGQSLNVNGGNRMN